MEFYLDGDTTVRVALLQRPDQGDWVVQVTSANSSEITVEQGEGKAFVTGRVR